MATAEPGPIALAGPAQEIERLLGVAVLPGHERALGDHRHGRVPGEQPGQWRFLEQARDADLLQISGEGTVARPRGLRALPGGLGARA
jgi:hypothetical protein